MPTSPSLRCDDCGPARDRPRTTGETVDLESEGLTSRNSSASARRSERVAQPLSWSAAERWRRRCSGQGTGLRRCGPSRTTLRAACRRAAWLEGCVSSFGGNSGCESVEVSECGSLREAREKEEGEERSTSEVRARERASEEECTLLLRGRGLCAPTSALRAWMSLGRAGEAKSLSLFPLPPLAHCDLCPLLWAAPPFC